MSYFIFEVVWLICSICSIIFTIVCVMDLACSVSLCLSVSLMPGFWNEG